MSVRPRFRAWFPILVASAAGVAASIPVPASAQRLRATPAADGKAVVIHVEPSRTRAPGLLEVVNGAGQVVRTLHGGRFGRTASFPLRADDELPPGSYTVRYREGLGLEFDREVKRPGTPDGRWINPTDLALVGRFVYVLDSGLVKQDGSLLANPVEPAGRAAAVQADETASREAEWSSCLYKLTRAGEADATFGKAGRVALGRLPAYRAFAIDPKAGTIFMALGGHAIHVLDADGNKTSQTIGGWDNDPQGPKGTGWPNSVAISPTSSRIYIITGYGHGKVYDRTKPGFAGIISRFALPRNSGLDRAVTAVGNAVYVTNREHLVQRFTDTGGKLALDYASGPDLKLAFPTGLGAVPGLIWAACHGPGLGPYWDSGGGGEVVLLFDDGGSLALVERYGFPGAAAEGLEFLNPSAAVPSPDHTELYVVEDGIPNPEGPGGNARIRRFRITAAATKQAVAVLRKP